MNNFPIKDPKTGETWWISRALAVVGIIILTDRETNEDYMFFQKRGPGCPDFVGAWSHTCGYLDFDETLEEALVREIREELGVDMRKLSPDITFYSINDDPTDPDNPKQNVSIRYILGNIDMKKFMEELDSADSSERGGESGEVAGTTVVRMDSGFRERLRGLQFAWNHRAISLDVWESWEPA